MTLSLDTLLELLLAISLSAATGFRVFVPLLVLSAAAVLGHIDLRRVLTGLKARKRLGYLVRHQF